MTEGRRWWQRALDRALAPQVGRRVALALSELDGFYPAGTPMERRDRWDYDRLEVQQQALALWRSNPLARRLVALTSEYVVGGGIALGSPDPAADAFLKAWWRHPLNQLDQRVMEWCDELTRSGELFFLLSSDAAGMTYVRAVPAVDISAVETAGNDLHQETGYVYRPAGDTVEERWQADDGRSLAPAMRHYAVNRPVGAVRGESDLAPVLRWLNRYASWLEDRARLNRYRTAFMYVVRARFMSETERLTRQHTLAANPPTPGSILVTDENESWEVLSPKLEADDANEDGLALKKMIAAGAGLPLHFLAEPESATRTTAEAADGAAFRRLEERQRMFLWMLGDLAQAALARRALVDAAVPAEALVEVRGTDLSPRDNAALAGAARDAMTAFMPLFERGLLDERELRRLVYRFAGEHDAEGGKA
jgi:hypothetical protein